VNTRINYLYRDAANYKQFGEVVVAGSMERNQLAPLLKDQEFFIPSKVGMADIQPDMRTEDDHIWHEIISLEQTSENPSLGITADQLLQRFKSAFENSWYELC
jgi:hypothetical protein